MLVGREGPCAHLERLLAEVRDGHSASLVLRGEAGTGKTALLRWAADHAGKMAVRSIRGIESEIHIPFSSLHDLFRQDLDAIRELPSAQSAALSSALTHNLPDESHPMAVPAATLSLLGQIAGSSGLLVLVDDVQWLDDPTAEALLFAARRLDTEGVLALLAVRDDEVAALDLDGLPELYLTGLSPEDARRLLEHRVGAVSPHVAEELFRTTGGNPLALTELAARLPRNVLAGEAGVEQPVRVGRRIEEAFARRVAALPAGTRRFLLIAAASDTQSLVTITAAADRYGIDLTALSPAEAAGLVTVDGERLEFAHPLLRSALYHTASPRQRRDAHRSIAEALPADQTERRVWHLARAVAGPDETVAQQLEDVAFAARRRAGPGGGARAFERAARLTPHGDRRARRLIEAARDLQLLGRVVDSLRLLDEAVATTDDPGLQADSEQLRARVEAWRGDPEAAFRTLLTRAESLREDDPARAAALFADAAVVATMRGDYRAEVATARDACAAARAASDPLLEGAAGVVLAHGLTNTGRGHEAEGILRGVEPTMARGSPIEGAPLLQLVAFTWMCLEDHDRARGFLSQAIGPLRVAGASGTLPFLLACQSMLDFRTGRWTNAHAASWEALQLAEQSGLDSGLAFYLVCLAQVEAGQGREDECRAHLRRAFQLTERFGVESVAPWAEASLGLLELGLGHHEQAIAVLERIPALAQRLGIGDPNLVRWTPDLIEAYVRTGDHQAAVSTLAAFVERAESTGRTWALATASRCRGLLASEGDFEEHFVDALRMLERTMEPFELARTQLCLGERLGLARRRREARRPLRAAVASFERLGARPWAWRARAELARNGGRTILEPERGLDQLTPQELQVALAVADGATNQEAAATLFLSVKTIEFHLSNAYRKLGIRSRTQLAALVNRSSEATREMQGNRSTTPVGELRS